MSRSYVAPFILAAAGTLAGCKTMEVARQEISEAWDKGKAAVTAAPAPETAQAAAPAQAAPRVLHPAVQEALDHIGAKRNQSFNAEAKCSASQLAGNGPDPATNRFGVNAPVKRVENALGGVVDQVLSRAGTVGQVAKPTTDAIQASQSARSDQLQVVCGRIGTVNKQWIAADALPDDRKGSIYQGGYNQLSTAMTLAANAKLTDGAVSRNGVDAMIGRGTNQSQTIVWEKVLNGIYTPKSSGGAFGDLINKIAPK